MDLSLLSRKKLTFFFYITYDQGPSTFNQFNSGGKHGCKVAQVTSIKSGRSNFFNQSFATNSASSTNAEDSLLIKRILLHYFDFLFMLSAVPETFLQFTDLDYCTGNDMVSKKKKISLSHRQKQLPQSTWAMGR